MLIATKADKIAKSKYKSSIMAIAKQLKVREEMFIVFSSQSGVGKEKILSYIENKLDDVNEKNNNNN